jgi:hypothetical protein
MPLMSLLQTIDATSLSSSYSSFSFHFKIRETFFFFFFIDQSRICRFFFTRNGKFTLSSDFFQCMLDKVLLKIWNTLNILPRVFICTSLCIWLHRKGTYIVRIYCLRELTINAKEKEKIKNS